jgi:hypothetical protein
MSSSRIIKLTFLFILSYFMFSSVPTYAVTAADWKPGRIIDDAVFADKNSMSVADIQAFLNAKVPACDTYGTTSTSRWNSGAGRYYTRAEWGAIQGSPAPFTCLRDFYEVPKSVPSPGIPANNYGGQPIPSGAISAAQMIWNAAQAYNISPRVLLVTIQKESIGPLTVDDWPYLGQYTYAMGAYCPDGPNGAECDQNYAGFSMQIRESAKLFRYYIDNQSQPWWPYKKPGQNNFVYWNVTSTGCGGSDVYIETAATAALYTYTPYQPNAAALANLYGSGDGCSAYGNRNFWRIYNDWFGSTLAITYSYSFVGSSYSSVELETGQKKTDNYITIKNTGSATWYSDGFAPDSIRSTRLSILNYENSVFADQSDPAWMGTRNQIKMTPNVVLPGENATFNFSLFGPGMPLQQTKNLTFLPVVNGVGFMPNINMTMIVSHKLPRYAFISASGLPQQILPNESIINSVTIKNTGNSTWYSDDATPLGGNSMRLSTKNYRETGFADQSDPAWMGTRNQIKMTPNVVLPGENAVFNFKMNGPMVENNEKIHFVPVLNGISFLNDIDIFTFINTPKPVVSYKFTVATNPPSVMSPGAIANVSIMLQNTGNTVWRNSTSKQGAYTSRLILSKPLYQSFDFYNSSDPAWITSGQVSMLDPYVMPGQNTRFNFSWKAPVTIGLYKQGIVPVIDGYQILPDIGMRFDTNVSL